MSGVFYNYIVCNIPSWTIRIGERSYINEYCHLDGRGGIESGDDTSISIYTEIILGTHNSVTFEEDKVLVGAGSTLPKGKYEKEALV